MENLNKVNYKEKILTFLKSVFNKKTIIWKLFIFLFCCTFFLPSAIALNIFAQNSTNQIYENPFISIYITTNSGMAFSFLNDNVAAVYTIQIITTLIILCIAMLSKKWYFCLFWTFAFLGGLFNIIDRACPKIVATISTTQVQYNVVMDYFKFTFIKWGIFNLPDAFVCVFVVIAMFTYIVQSIIQLCKKDDKNKIKSE